MAQLGKIEKDIVEMKASLAEIKKIFGIGTNASCKIIDIRRRAMPDAELLKRTTKHPKDIP